MNKNEFIERVALTKGHTKKDTKMFLEDILEIIQEVVAEGEKLCFKDFGIFEAKETVERTGRNPKTKEEFKIPASKKIKFKAGAIFKRTVLNK